MSPPQEPPAPQPVHPKPSPLERMLRRSPAGSGDFQRSGRRLYQPGNLLALLPNGDATFQAMWEAIDRARETVHLETYIFESDFVGEEFAARLAERAKAGVRVRVILDSLGSLDLDPALLTRLRNSGVQVLEYHPVVPWRSRWHLQRRDHRKILVVDGRVGFTGGVNISSAHASLASGGADWRDVHVRVEGPAALALDRLFQSVWFRETERWFEPIGDSEARPGRSLVWVAANDEFMRRYTIRSAYLQALRAARREISIANAYFVPDRGIRRALAAASRRGVRVRILVPGRSDVTAPWYAGRYRYEWLLRHGIRLHEWTGPILHSKMAIIDRTWCAVGSYNLDHVSLLHNLEVNLHIIDEAFARALADEFDEDVARSREIALAAWRRRPLADKAFERLFHLVRYFV